jgi:hypothetical protein
MSKYTYFYRHIKDLRPLSLYVVSVELGVKTANSNRTYAKVHAVGAIHELPLHQNKGFGYCLRKSCLNVFNAKILNFEF